MKQFRSWLLGVVPVAALGAAVLGPTVWGQPEPLPPPTVPPLTEPAKPAPVVPPTPPGLPALPGVEQVTPPPVMLTDPPAAAKSASAGPREPAHAASKPDGAAPAMPPAPTANKPGGAAPTTPAAPSKGTNALSELRLGRQEPAVSIEWSGPPMVRLGQPMMCQLVVRNIGGVSVNDVVVRHRPSEGVTYHASEPRPAIDQGELVWSLGTLAAGQVRRIDLQMVVQLKGPLTCQATVTFSGAASHQVQVNEPQLQLKLKAPEHALPGETVTLLYTVSNPGDGPAEAVKLKTMLPDGLEHQQGKLIEVELGTLAAKEKRTLQLTCTTRGSGLQKCEAVASADGNLTASDVATLDVLTPRLELAMLGPKLRYIDRKANYVLKVTNPGSAPAANVVVHGVVPASFKYHGSSGGGVYDEAVRTVSWVVGDLAPGQCRDVTLEVVPTAPGDHQVTAQVMSARGLKTEAEVRTVVAGVPALLIEVVDTDDPVEVGADTTYEVRVTNVGTKTESNIVVVCALPETVELRAAKAGSLHHKVDGREVCFEALPKLAPRADLVYRVQVRGKAAGDVRFRVRVRADGLTEPVLREECTRFYNDDAPAK
jgi:uncharacterized repeat protein (TIGR01451 family)